VAPQEAIKHGVVRWTRLAERSFSTFFIEMFTSLFRVKDGGEHSGVMLLVGERVDSRFA